MYSSGDKPTLPMFTKAMDPVSTAVMATAAKLMTTKATAAITLALASIANLPYSETRRSRVRLSV